MRGVRITGAATATALAVRRKAPVCGVLVGLLWALTLGSNPTPADAVVAQLPGGQTLSYQPIRGAATIEPSAHSLSSLDFTDLDYDGGPVMASNTNYTLYWRPPMDRHTPLTISRG